MRFFRISAFVLGALVAAGCAQTGAFFSPTSATADRGSGAAAKPAASSTLVIYRFAGGANKPAGPQGGVTGYGGALFGAISVNGTYGMVYTLVTSGPSTWVFKPVYNFKSSADGSEPYGLIADAKGSLYGSTLSGGTLSLGTVYKLEKSGATYKHTILHSMSGSGGNQPLQLTLDASGAIYGVTSYGGTGTACGSLGCGTVFKLTPSGSTYAFSTLYSFKAGTDGLLPIGALAVAKNGTVYGVTSEGGTTTSLCGQGCGTIFSLTPAGKTYHYSTLYRFADGTDGRFPTGGIVLGDTTSTQSTLYGVTSGGGDVAECYTPQNQPGCGTVFSYAAAKKHILYSFRGYTYGDGEIPVGGLIATPSGLLGTTSEGGVQADNAFGTLWFMPYGGSGYRTLHNFDGAEYAVDGRSPDSGISSAGGAFYTSMQQGGGSKNCGPYGCGVVVEFKP